MLKLFHRATRRLCGEEFEAKSMTEETTKPLDAAQGKPTDFIREAVAEDLRTGRFN